MPVTCVNSTLRAGPPPTREGKEKEEEEEKEKEGVGGKGALSSKEWTQAQVDPKR